MIRKFYFLLVGLFLLLCDSISQETWSLSDCIQYALEKNLDVKRQHKEIERQEIQQQANMLSRLPDLNTGGTQKFDFGRSLNRDNTYNDINSQNSSLTLTTEATLFNGMKTVHTIARQKLELKVHHEILKRLKMIFPCR